MLIEIVKYLNFGTKRLEWLNFKKSQRSLHEMLKKAN